MAMWNLGGKGGGGGGREGGKEGGKERGVLVREKYRKVVASINGRNEG